MKPNLFKNLSSTITILFFTVSAFSQQENYNKQWIQGFPRTIKTTFTGAGPVNQFWDSLNMKVFLHGHSNICTGGGDLVLATDGRDVYGADAQVLDNGDTI